MKLKKIAALALAGVMAVSMLAGCAGKGTDDKKDPTDTSTNATYTQYLVDALNADSQIKAAKNVKVVAGTGLQSALDAAVKQPGMTVDKVLNYMTAVDSSLKTDKLPQVQRDNENAKYEADSTAQSYFNVIYANDNGMNQASYTVKNMASTLKNSAVSQDNSKSVLNVESHSSTYTDTVSQKTSNYYFNFEYTLEVAVAPVKDTASNTVYYVTAYKVTRTPTKVDGTAPKF